MVKFNPNYVVVRKELNRVEKTCYSSCKTESTKNIDQVGNYLPRVMAKSSGKLVFEPLSLNNMPSFDALSSTTTTCYCT